MSIRHSAVQHFPFDHLHTFEPGLVREICGSLIRSNSAGRARLLAEQTSIGTFASCVREPEPCAVSKRREGCSLSEALRLGSGPANLDLDEPGIHLGIS